MSNEHKSSEGGFSRDCMFCLKNLYFPFQVRVVGLVIRPPVSTLAPPLAPGRSQAAPEVLGAGSITTILGAPDIYFRPGPGTLVNITCVVSSLKRPEHIFWYHNGQVSQIGHNM